MSSPPLDVFHLVEGLSDDQQAASAAMPAPDKPEKKRRRPALSCEQCRRRKIRCDRNVPCNHCVKSKISTCSYAVTHVPASRAKKQQEHQQQQQPLPSPARHSEEPVKIQPQPAPTPDLPTPSSEYIGPNYPQLIERGASPSLPSSRAGSASEASHVDYLLARVQQLEEKLAATHVTDPVAGPGDGVLESKDECRLSKGVVAKTRYFGQSHWMNGAQLLPMQLGMLTRADHERSELFNVFNKSKILGRSIKHKRFKPLSSEHLGESIPSRELADQLVETYLRTFEGVMRVVHVPTFRAEYERYWENPAAASEHFPILLQLCMALGATLHDTNFSLRSLATQWVYEAQLWLILPPEKSRMTIAGIQIMCLLNLAKAVCGAGHDLTWITTGALLRKAMYMGLHRDPRRLANMTRYRAELRRRLWATILELNLQSSFDAGGSPLLSINDYDTRPPANLDDDQLGDEPDTSNVTEQPADVPTQMTVQIELLKSHALRTSLLKHVNDVQTPASYTETLHLNSNLTNACRRMTQVLTKISEKTSRTGPGVTAFHIAVAELFLYRCYHALHQPVMGKSIQDPKYYFSRKMCLDSALKITHLCGLSGSGLAVGETGSTLPRDSEFRRLIISGTGMFRNIPVQSIFGVIIAMIHHRGDQTSSLGYLPSLGNSDLRSCLAAAMGWAAERIESGETNIKGSCVMAACMAQIDAEEAGLNTEDTETAIVHAAEEASLQSWEALKVLAKREGVPVEEAEAAQAVEMDGVEAFSEAWIGDMMWDMGDAWQGMGPGAFDEMSPMFAGQLGQF